MFGIGMTELLVIFVIGLLVLGPKRLPELARSLGRGIAEFRRASMDIRREFMDVADEVRIRPPSLEETASGMPPQAGDVGTPEPSGTPAQAGAQTPGQTADTGADTPGQTADTGAATPGQTADTGTDPDPEARRTAGTSDTPPTGSGHG